MMKTNRMSMPFAVALAAAGLLAGCDGGGGSGGGGGGGGGGTAAQFGTVAGQVSAGGAGLQGVAVSVSGAGNATTAADGTFRVENVPVGNPTVSMTMPAGFIVATAGDPTSRVVSVTAGQTANVSFALKRGVQVVASGVSFAPQNVAVGIGGTVRWVNGGGGGHTVTAAGTWTGGNLPDGATYEHTFNADGTYNYHCIPHQSLGMAGTVTVGAGGAPSPGGPNPDPGYP